MGNYVKVYLTDLELELVNELKALRIQEKNPYAAVNAIMKEGLHKVLVEEEMAVQWKGHGIARA